MSFLLFSSACGHIPDQEADQKSGELAFPKITEPYTSELAAQNGDVVLAADRTANMDKWEHFLASVKNGRVDHVRVIEYTVEGGPAPNARTSEPRRIRTDKSFTF